MEYTGAGIITTFKIKYDGAEIADYHNEHGSVVRDRALDSVLPGEICSCALGRKGATCMREKTIKLIAQHLDVPLSDAPVGVMRALMKKTGCTDEKCVLSAAREMKALSAEEAGIEEQIAFKQAGPTDTTLFNDGVIQAQLYAWMFQFRDFWAYNFNMLDYARASLRNGRVMQKPDTLATTNWEDLFAGRVPMPVGMRGTPAQQVMLAAKRKGVRCGACVINSDTYDGNGKHWMALFVDARATGASPCWTIEFFNSAAVRPESEWLEWMVKTKRELQKCNPSARIETICACKVWHQHSRSECGPYSIFYVWARLNGISPQYFMESVVPDQMMFEFRQHLFGIPASSTERFDFAQFAKQARIKWDTEDISGNKRRDNI